MMCMSQACGPWCDGLWRIAFKWFEFLRLLQACAQEGLMTEKYA